jgi:DNA helicase-2/ATP-dependent DNA helicase PcrA
MERVLNESGYIQMLKDDKNREEANERLDNLKAMLRGMEDYETISSFLEHVALVMDGDTNDTNSVKLMTIHAAKGLEFDNVFIPGFEDGLFPHQRSLDDSGPKALEEERRLAYVAITRAKKKLVISYAQARRMYGNYMPAVASRFLNELPTESTKQVKAAASGGGYYPSYNRGGASAQPKWSQPSWHSCKPEPVKPSFTPTVVATVSDDDSPYGIGVRVFHQKFGYGRVKAADGEGPERKVVILFEKAGEKRLLESLANLEIVK